MGAAGGVVPVQLSSLEAVRVKSGQKVNLRVVNQKLDPWFAEPENDVRLVCKLPVVISYPRFS